MLFQKDNVTLTLVKDGLEHTTLLLTAMVARLGPYLQEFLQNIGDGNIFQEIELKRGHQDLIQFNTTPSHGPLIELSATSKIVFRVSKYLKQLCVLS